MGDVAIRLDRLSKMYRLHRGWYFSLRQEIGRLGRRLFVGEPRIREEFWALRGVSLEIEHGETIGLIGANGAGKSTLLKVLSRVTVPTAGSFTVNGTVGALIEIGAGFHPELTGRENVHLNAAIMGMGRREIAAKFDRIVEFAEMEKFIETPIKYYSSGMLVRLGFAVAAHIDPDILLVDEVLAVGDAAFQAKCLNKMAELKEQRRTIVLVSHAMPSILAHSSRVLWIDRGAVREFGEPERVVEAYLDSVHATAAAAETPALAGDSPIRIREVVVRNARGEVNRPLEYGRAAALEVGYEVRGPVEDPVIGVTFHDVHGTALGGLTTRFDGVKLDVGRRRGVARLLLSPVLFTRGPYSASVAIHDAGIQRYLDLRARAVSFTVDGPSLSSREVGGHIVLPHRWETRDGDA
jgi:ABC-2 type transport system ATP-binding protein